MNRLGAAFSAFMIVSLCFEASTAHADVAQAASTTATATETTSEPLGVYDGLLVGSVHGGLLVATASADTTMFGPGFGIGLEGWLHENFGAGLTYNFGFNDRGTSEVSVFQTRHLLTLMPEARLRMLSIVVLVAGVGAGVSLLTSSSQVGDDSESTGTFEPGITWLGAIDVLVWRIAFRLGAMGLVHESSHDQLYYLGVSFPLIMSR